jgi:sugar lactone lactonase YvrE
LESDVTRRISLWAAVRLGVAAAVVAGGCGIGVAPAAASPTSTYQLSLLAGVPGSIGSPTNGQFFEPTGMAYDSAGNAYLADTGNSTIDMITPSGQVSVVAGGGSTVPTAGSTISATAAVLANPYDVAVDTAGNLYIADTQNELIEKVTPSGQLSVIAGGGGTYPTPGTTIPATSASLNGPSGVAVDAAGNVYVADASNDEVEEITPSGQLSVIAGGGGTSPTVGTTIPATSAALGSPYTVTVDSAGDVYVDDGGDNEIDEVTPQGQLSIVAGNGQSSNPPTDGLATDASLEFPDGVAVDGAGDLYIVDGGDGDVSEVTPDGQLTVIAGNGNTGPPTYGVDATTTSINTPAGIASTPAGQIAIGDSFNETVDLLEPIAAPVGTVAPAVSGAATVGQTLSSTEGNWDNVPILYGYQWQDCDSAGANCSDIAGATASSYSLTDADVGHTVRVEVTAANGAGATTADSPETAVVAAAVTTPIPTTPTTATSPTTGTPSTGTGDGVTLSAQAAEAGLDVSGTSAVQLPLVCPHTPTGCDADGNLALALSAARSHARTADAQAPIKSSVIAQFAGVHIQTGQSRLVSVTLTPAATRYLQVRGIRRVRVTLTIHNHLSGGAAITTTQHVWLNIAALQASCPAAIGTLTGSSIAQMRLGLTRRQAHRLGPHRKAGYGFERYCLTGGAIRVRYPASKLLRTLSAAQRHQDQGRVYLALTANKHYTAGHVRNGMTITAARTRLRLGTGVTVGKNTWYLVAAKKAAWVLKAQHGIIREIGITTRSLTSTRQARQRLLHNL